MNHGAPRVGFENSQVDPSRKVAADRQERDGRLHGLALELLTSGRVLRWMVRDCFPREEFPSQCDSWEVRIHSSYLATRSGIGSTGCRSGEKAACHDRTA